MKFRDIYTDTRDGSLSHTKLWANIALLTGTVVIIVQACRATLTADMLLVYLASATCHHALVAFVSTRFGAPPAPVAEPDGEAD